MIVFSISVSLSLWFIYSRLSWGSHQLSCQFAHWQCNFRSRLALSLMLRKPSSLVCIILYNYKLEFSVLDCVNFIIMLVGLLAGFRYLISTVVMYKGVVTDLKVGGSIFCERSEPMFLGPPTFCKDPPLFGGVIPKCAGVLKSFSTQ